MNDPIPLETEHNLPAFPTDALPDWWRNYVTAQAHATQTPTDLSASVTLGVLAACVSGRIDVQVHDSWTETTNLFVLPAMEPGARKSPVFTAAIRPLVEVEKELRDETHSAIAERAALKSLKEDRAASLRKAAATGDSTAEAEYLQAVIDADSIIVPASPRILAEDATPEALASLAADQGGRIAVAAAEGGIFDNFAGRYSGGVPNVDVLLHGHAGEPYRVDRKGREPELIERLTLTIAMTVQPSVLKNLDRNTPEGASRGELERFLYALPKSTMGFRSINPPPVPPGVKDEYLHRVSTLARHYWPVEASATLRFSDAAFARFADVQRAVETELRPDGKFGRSARLRGWGGKLAGAIARIAGILHVASGLDHHTPISADCADSAARIGAYFGDHAVAVFDFMTASSPNAKAIELLNDIRRLGMVEFSKRDLFTALSRSRWKKVAELDEPLELLFDYGWIDVLEGEYSGKGRPPSPRYMCHPHVFNPPTPSAKPAEYAEPPQVSTYADYADYAEPLDARDLEARSA